MSSAAKSNGSLFPAEKVETQAVSTKPFLSDIRCSRVILPLQALDVQRPQISC
jgi:hypothetical protein